MRVLFNYLAVNEVGSPAKEELNLFLWLLCQEVCGYVYGRLDLRSLHPKSPSHVDPADPVFWVPAHVCLEVRKPNSAKETRTSRDKSPTKKWGAL